MKNQEFTIRIPSSEDVKPAELRGFIADAIQAAAAKRGKKSPVQELAGKAKVLRPYNKRTVA